MCKLLLISAELEIKHDSQYSHSKTTRKSTIRAEQCENIPKSQFQEPSVQHNSHGDIKWHILTAHYSLCNQQSEFQNIMCFSASSPIQTHQTTLLNKKYKQFFFMDNVKIDLGMSLNFPASRILHRPQYYGSVLPLHSFACWCFYVY